eukprot:985233-Lingulodinium_polyedra.AAC.1
MRVVEVSVPVCFLLYSFHRFLGGLDVSLVAAPPAGIVDDVIHVHTRYDGRRTHGVLLPLRGIPLKVLQQKKLRTRLGRGASMCARRV